MLYLLTHETEVGRSTNTGRLVQQVLGDHAITIVWRRTQPDVGLQRRIQLGGLGLLWPTAGAQALGPHSPRDYVLIDATWQNARKMNNRSPYLHGLQTVALNPTEPSAYSSRRNQVAGGLCTIEAAAELLARTEQNDEAAAMRAAFARFMGFAGSVKSP